MRILQLHDETWDSGIAHYALTLARELSRQGLRVFFWAAAGSFALKKAEEAGLAALGISRPWLRLPGLRRRVGDLGIELINAHTGSSHSLAAALAWGRRIAVVRTRADARPPASHPLARLLARRTQAFIAPNTRIRQQLRGAFPSVRVELVLPGIPAPEPSPLPDSPVVGILGRLDPVKGHQDMLAAAGLLRGRFPEARFLAAGDGRPERLARLQGLAHGRGMEFLGYVEDSAAFMARCRIGVVASVYSEAVSRAALEWMSLGRPLVATSVGGLPDLLAEGETGFLVPPGNPGQLAQALARLLESPELAFAMGAKARERFEGLFGLKRLAEETESAYQEALRGLFAS